MRNDGQWFIHWRRWCLSTLSRTIVHRQEMHFTCFDILKLASAPSTWEDTTFCRFSVLLFGYDANVFGLVGLVVGGGTATCATCGGENDFVSDAGIWFEFGFFQF